MGHRARRRCLHPQRFAFAAALCAAFVAAADASERARTIVQVSLALVVVFVAFQWIALEFY